MAQTQHNPEEKTKPRNRSKKGPTVTEPHLLKCAKVAKAEGIAVTPESNGHVFVFSEAPASGRTTAEREQQKCDEAFGVL